MKLSVTERKVREYTELDSVLWTELLIWKGELQRLLPYLTYIQIHKFKKPTSTKLLFTDTTWNLKSTSILVLGNPLLGYPMHTFRSFSYHSFATSYIVFNID